RHVKLILDSRRQDVIKAIKIWRNLRELDFPSIYLELVVLEALKRNITRIDQPSRRIVPVFEFLAEKFVDARIVDPSNTNNIISHELTREEKERIASEAVASLTLARPHWDKILWCPPGTATEPSVACHEIRGNHIGLYTQVIEIFDNSRSL